MIPLGPFDSPDEGEIKSAITTIVAAGTGFFLLAAAIFITSF